MERAQEKRLETDPEILVEVEHWDKYLLPDEKKKEEDRCKVVPINKADCVKIYNLNETLRYDVIIIENFFSKEECDRLLVAAEEFGFGVTNYPKAYRGNLRLQVLDKGLFSHRVYSRIKEYLPEKKFLKNKEYEVCGLNEMWRLAKYYPGDRFQGHCDADFVDHRQSLYTVNIYVNEGFEGGKTRFYNEIEHKEIDFEIIPKKGTAVLFRQPPEKRYFHDGEELKSGNKYLFRSDVMYKHVKS